MSKTFRSYDLNQQLLLPPDLRQWLAADHLALYLSDVVESLNLTEILNAYEAGEGRGRPPYQPVLMVKLLIYGYCTGRMSSRKIEQATHDDVAFRVLACNQQPDHDSIAAFRKRHLAALAKLFVQILELCQRAGLVKLGHVAIDGTKIKANASKWRTLSYAGMSDAEAKLSAEVERLLAEAQRIDEEEDALYGKGKRGDELPAELRERESRLARIRELQAEMEREARQAAEKKAVETKRKREQAEKQGKKFTARKVIDPSQAVPAAKSKRNFTDPDSRIMKDHASKTFQQAYNTQIGVDAQAQIIVAAKVVQAGVDQEQLVPVLCEVERNLGRMPVQASADAGYYSKAALTHEALRGVDLHVPPNQRKPRPGEEQTTLPTDATLQERMWHKLASKAGREVFSRRKVIVEPVFAQIKHVRGFRQFLLRGLGQVEAEWLLVCMTHNLLKVFRAQQSPQIA
jgi:transposase